MKKLFYVIAIVFIQHSSFNIQNSHAQVANDNIGAGNCLEFNGTTDLVGNIGAVADYSFVQNTRVFTIEAWIRLDNPNATAYQGIMGNSVTFAERGFDLGFENRWGSQQILISCHNGAANSFSFSQGNIITDSDWHHIAIVGNVDEFSFYIDGVGPTTFAAQGGGGLSTGSAARVLQLGNLVSAWPFDGNLDEVRIWNTSRTQAQIRDNMCAQLTGSETGLVGYWNMNEGTGATVNDLTTNANHGTRQ